MDTLMKILNEIDDSINWEKEKAVIDDRLLDSFGVITLVSELEDAFGIEIEASCYPAGAFFLSARTEKNQVVRAFGSRIFFLLADQ